MKYKIDNYSKFSKDDIHTAIKFCAPKGITNFTVQLAPAASTDYSIWSAYATLYKGKPVVKFFFQKERIKFPQMSNDREAIKAGYYPICKIKDKYEMLIYLFSHELRHVWQFTVSKNNFLKSKRKFYTDSDGRKYSTIFGAERDACQY